MLRHGELELLSFLFHDITLQRYQSRRYSRQFDLSFRLLERAQTTKLQTCIIFFRCTTMQLTATARRAITCCWRPEQRQGPFANAQLTQR